MQLQYEQLMTLLRMVWGFAGVKVLVTTVLLNTIVAIAAAVVTKDFQLHRIWEFMGYKILPKCMAYVTAKVLEDSVGVPGLSAAVFAILEASLAADLADSLAKLGVPWTQRFLKDK